MADDSDPLLDVHPQVRRVLERGGPVVALESTLLAHGLPAPDNLRVGQEVEAAVRAEGATPATIAVLDGRVRVGLDVADLARVCGTPPVPKLGVRDLAAAVASGGAGATTVASTAVLAHRCGIRVMATGGLGGVHRSSPVAGPFDTVRDESADLRVLAATPITVVCSGVKSVLDVPATLERLETLSVPVLGYQTNRFPGFYLTDSGHRLDWRVETPEQVVAIVRAAARLGVGTAATVVANPVPPDEQLDPDLHDRALGSALAGLVDESVTGPGVTPYLLDHFHRHTAGQSLRVNVALVLRNATLAARIAVANGG